MFRRSVKEANEYIVVVFPDPVTPEIKISPFIESITLEIFSKSLSQSPSLDIFHPSCGKLNILRWADSATLPAGTTVTRMSRSVSSSGHFIWPS